MSTGHTPTPWTCEHPTLAWYIREQVGEEGGQLIAVVEYHRDPARQEADARLIVRAVNAHAALVEAAETYLSNDLADDYWEDIVESHHNCGCDWCARAARVLAARKALRAALALAKGDAP